jgi:23S rRNA (pseudouridine1915-N3)-methyltransferase
MKLKIIAVGFLKNSPERELIEGYCKQLNWHLQIIEVATSSALSGKALKEFEAEKIITKIPANSLLIAMDEHGKSITSQAFSNLLGTIETNEHKTVSFLIGGANGLAKSLLDKSKYKIAMGHMTWPHKLARVMLVEQIYRAEKILQGHPYHRV